MSDRMVVVSHTKVASTAVGKPKMRVSTGFVKCNWCDRKIDRGLLYFVQRQVTSDRREYCGKLCRPCGEEKRGSIYFEPFICRLKKEG